MYVFKIKKSYRIILSVFVAFFYALALAVMIYFAVQGIKNYFAYAVLGLIVFILPVFFSFILISDFSAYFVFYNDSFEYHRNKRFFRILAKNIRYYFFKDGILTIYFEKADLSDYANSIFKESKVIPNLKEKGIAVNVERPLFKITIPNIGNIENSILFLEWFQKNIPVLPDGQALKDYVELYNKYENVPQEKIEETLERAQKFATYLNWASVICTLWIIFYPRPAVLAVFANIAMPFFMIYVLHRTRGFVLFDKKGNSIYPTICLMQILPVFGLGFFMIDKVSFVDVKLYLIESVIFYFVYLAIFMVFQKEFSYKEKYTYGAMLLYSLFFIGFAFGAVAAINCCFDFEEPVQTTIIEKSQEITVYLHRGLLGIGWY